MTRLLQSKETDYSQANFENQRLKAENERLKSDFDQLNQDFS